MRIHTSSRRSLPAGRNSSIASPTTPATVTLAGHTGRYLEYQLAADATCGPDETKLFRLAPLVCGLGCGGLGPPYAAVEFPVAGVQNRAWILDAGGGQRLVLVTQATPAASAAELAELQALIDSIGIVDTPPATPAAQPSTG